MSVPVPWKSVLRELTTARQHRIAAILVIATTVALSGCGDDRPPKARAADAVQKGLAEHVAGRLDDALTHYNQALEVEPNNTYALYNLGLIAQTRGNVAEAERRYREVLAIDPRFTSALFNLAIVRATHGGDSGLTEAIDLYRRVIAISPKDANAHLNLGFALKEAGQTADGERALRQAVVLDPKLASRIPRPSPSPRPAASTPSPSPS